MENQFQYRSVTTGLSISSRSISNHEHAGLVCKIPGYTAHLKRTVARSRPFQCVQTSERVRIDKKSTGGPPAHKGQPAHQRSSAQVSQCSSSERSKNTDALKRPQWLDNTRSTYRNTPSGPSLVTPVARGSGRDLCKRTRDTHSTWP